MQVVGSGKKCAESGGTYSVRTRVRERTREMEIDDGYKYCIPSFPILLRERLRRLRV